MAEIYWGDALIKRTVDGGSGDLVLRDGERFYKITNYHKMPAFFMTVVSAYDHWMFLSSSGGLSCGRGNPDRALFPYQTDDKIHDSCSTTGPQTAFLVSRNSRTFLWKPFSRDVDVYGLERNLFKNLAGNKLVFEEINHDLGLVFSYTWSSSERFGFVKRSTVQNTGVQEVRVEVLDGLRNILPSGVTQSLQAERSTLVDAYRQAESVPGLAAAIYSLSSIPTDRAEPSEALSATVVWSTGLGDVQLLLSEDQVDSFCTGTKVSSESNTLGKRGAFYVRSDIKISPDQHKSWYVLADLNQGPSALPALLETVRRGVSPGVIESDIDAGTRRLIQLVGGADGCQLSSDAMLDVRHFSNTLFNIMRGGTFYDEYRFPGDDFLSFTGAWNRPLEKKFTSLLGSLDAAPHLATVMAAAERVGDADMERIALEYLPLTFSRRHGDPSRPWNQFSIDIRNADGSDKLNYQGNWRDIFQNWEALAGSFPEFAESFIAKFVNASTADGYNPYRITREGFEWEILDPEDPWSNIGYWGDHQLTYLLKLLEFSDRYHPGKIRAYLDRAVFVYADVPYRIKGYQSLVKDPRNSVEYDEARAASIAGRVAQIGSDGNLLALPDGSIYHVSLLEKLLVTSLSKISNFVPGGGIWMNTQRPEWNDANNALVGYGLSMVTLCYLRRFLVFLSGLLEKDSSANFLVSTEVSDFFEGIDEVLTKNTAVLAAAITPQDRKAVTDQLGVLGEAYRRSVYDGFSGEKMVLDNFRLMTFIELTLSYLDHSIAHNRRADGLFHSYNLINFGDDGYVVENLCEMLEGQVAVLSSNYLGAKDVLEVLDALRASKMYRSDQNSYMLYPFEKLPPFREKNVIDPTMVEDFPWIQRELASVRDQFIEKDVNGKIHFNGRFRNTDELRTALDRDGEVSNADRDRLCDVFEAVFQHRQFTGRSGAMYKYEGLGCIYWHMVSKLLHATSEMAVSASQDAVDQELVGPLLAHFDMIKDGLGMHKEPALYGAFPVDPYSHTTSFSGVQQPGMTGQVKEDIITRFTELGLNVHDGEIRFAPFMLKREEFITKPETWCFTVGGEELSEELEARSLAYCLCGVPVIYRLAKTSTVQIFTDANEPKKITGNRLGRDWTQSLFRREKQIRKIIVEVPEDMIR